MKRMILLTYTFPPLSSGGTPVVLNLVRYMPPSGWEVLPLTVSNPRGLSVDRSLESLLPEDLRVTRIHHTEPFRRPGSDDAPALDPNRRKQGFLTKLLKRIIHSYVLVPDRVITWGHSVVPAGVALAREEGASVVVSFGPHHSLHVHASKIAGKAEIPFVAFFGDLWLADSNVNWPSALNRRIEESMEKSIVRKASGIAVTTAGAAGYFERTYTGLCPPLHVVENGYDPDRTGAPTPPPDRGDNLLITYTGNFIGNQSPEPLLKGLDIFFGRHPDAPLRLRFVGSMEDVDSTLPGVAIMGPVPYQKIPSLQSGSDVLLAYLNPFPGSEMKNSSKLAEYLRTGRTILAVAPEGDMTGYVRRFDAGYVCRPDPEAVANTLETLLDHWEKGSLKRTSAHDAIAEVFDARNVTMRFASFLEDVVKGHSLRS